MPRRFPEQLHDKTARLATFAAALFLIVLFAPALSAQPIAVVPEPREVTRLEGVVRVGSGSEVIAPGLEPQGAALREALAHLAVAQGLAPTAGVPIELAIDPALAAEESHLECRADSIRLVGGSALGVSHASATLFQLLQRSEGAWVVPALAIRDQPDAEYRAVMVDVARHPHSIETLQAVVDLMWLYKLRFLQLHLTDDQSFTFPFEGVTDRLPRNWSIPIEKYRELVDYADARGVAIVPELDLPGHSRKLKESGYLEDPTPSDGLTDRDVADPVNHERLFRIIDAMLDVFDTSPYFHIGGDESGAGEALIPFLVAVNRHLRDRPVGERKRLLVWEGFHGAPEALPATGDDRIVVVSWESSYNPPWSLLAAGYELINASWKPLYAVGGGAEQRLPHHGGRRWSAREILSWDKDQFWHWQPGTPVFEDRGPQDDRRGDGIWTAPAERRAQVLGGQLCFWEQRDSVVISGALERLPALAESLWNGSRSRDFVSFQRRREAVEAEKARGLVQPVRVGARSPTVPLDIFHPTSDDMVWFDRSVEVTLEGPSPRSLGVVRYTLDGAPVTPASSPFTTPIRLEGRTVLRAAWFVEGQRRGVESKVVFDNRSARVQCSWFDLPRRALDHVPDFSDRSQWIPTRVDLLPELRGPYRTTHPVGQMLEGAFRVEPGAEGTYTFRLQTRDGRSNLFIDGTRVLGPSDPSEKQLFIDLELAAGLHSVRVDHAGGAISPVVIAAIRAPDASRFTDLSNVLVPIPRDSEPQRVPLLRRPLNLLENGLADWRFVGAEGDDLAVLREGVLRLAGRPQGYLETTRWFREYELTLEWRWPDERGGNSGVLVHATAPSMFYGWPKSLEVQLQSGRAGDFWVIGDEVSIRVEDHA